MPHPVPSSSPWRGRVLLWAALAFSVVPPPAWAQIDTGGIAGAVTDETGAALPGVTITVVSLTTGQTRVVTADAEGRYVVLALPPSRFSLTAELPGFATVERPAITVNIGSVLDVNITMRVATLQETVTVTGEAPLVQSKKTELSTVITEQFLETLPSRTRQYLDFALLMPTATESVTRIQGTGAVVGAARSKEGNLLVDGFYNMDEMFAMPKQRHSQDSIQEFQVLTFGGSAEHGRAIGGIINAVTKSGTNTLRGSGYGYFRDERLSAQDYGEKRRGTPESQFDRRQWGGTLGGPIKRNRSFFFAAYERLAEKIPFDNGIRPDHAAIIGLPPADVGVIERRFPVNFVLGKWNHNLSDNQVLEVSYSLTRQTDHNWSQAPPLHTRSATWAHLFFFDQQVLAKWQVVARQGRALHEIKATYSPRDYLVGEGPEMQIGGPPLVPEGQINFGKATNNASPIGVSIAGVATFGSAGLIGQVPTRPVGLIYTSSFYAGKHSIKFGADYLYTRMDSEYQSSYVGRYSFRSLQAFLSGEYSTYSQTFGSNFLSRRHDYLSAFVQDSWAISGRLTMNYGVRYDLELQPEHKQTGTRAANDVNNFGPRLAFSYDLTDKGKTFLKLTSGLYYDKIWGNSTFYLNSVKGYEQTVSATWLPTTPGAPRYPNSFAVQPATLPQGVRNASLIPSDLKVPMSLQLVGTLEHAVTNNLAITGSVVFSRAWHKEYTWDTNLEWDAAAGRWVRPDPSYRSINEIRYGGPAEYIGGFVQVTRRGARAGFDGNVTVARAYETATSPGLHIGGLVTDQRIGVRGDYGNAADVPRVRGVVSGWLNINPRMQISGIFRGRTGLAVDPIAQGFDLNGDGRFNDRTPTFEPYAFRGPGMSSLDLRFTWMLPLQAATRLQIYVESFNLLNTESPLTVLNNYGPDPASPHPRWLEPVGFFPPRQVQLGARITF